MATNLVTLQICPRGLVAGMPATRQIAACLASRASSACSPIGEYPIGGAGDRKSTRLNSSHGYISYAVFCLKKKKKGSRRKRITSLRHDLLNDKRSLVTCRVT